MHLVHDRQVPLSRRQMLHSLGLVSAGILLANSPPSANADDANTPYTTSTGLIITDLIQGSGKAAESGKVVKVDYTGWLEKFQGKQFDSSKGRRPLSFKLGEGRVIQGWEQGIVGMKVGGKRRLEIPSDLAYGSRQIGPIPANSKLFFEVELKDVI